MQGSMFVLSLVYNNIAVVDYKLHRLGLKEYLDSSPMARLSLQYIDMVVLGYKLHHLWLKG